MPRWLSFLLCVMPFRIRTRLTKEQVQNRLRGMIDTDRRFGHVWLKRFFMSEKHIWCFRGGKGRNSFAPHAWGKIIECEGGVTVSGCVQMFLVAQLVSWLLLLCLPAVVVLPQATPVIVVWWVAMYFAFYRPAKNIIAELTAALTVTQED